jgi:hypothetical protein
VTVSERLAFAEALESRAAKVLYGKAGSHDQQLRHSLLTDIAAAIREECGQKDGHAEAKR